jgi:hypothetical protein
MSTNHDLAYEIQDSIVSDVHDYKVRLEKERFAPFIGKRAFLTLYDGETATSGLRVEGIIRKLWISPNGDFSTLLVEIAFRSPNSGLMTSAPRPICDIDFLEPPSGPPGFEPLTEEQRANNLLVNFGIVR